MPVLLICLLMHAVLASVFPSPWWVPNLTVIGIVLAVGHAPKRWILFSAIAGLVTMAWAVRFPWLVMGAFLALGFSVKTLANHWDATDIRVQALVLSVAMTTMVGCLLWFEGIGSIPLLGLAAVHIAATYLSLPIIRWVLHVR
jgi:hypothetical protein